jgi:enoyl-CoA hydratase/carnithine racemase
MNEHVRTSIEERVLCITLNRPEKKNALTQDMYAVMTAALEEAASADDVRAMLITGSGDSYTSGNDIKDFQRPSSDQSGPGPLEAVMDLGASNPHV